MKRNINWAMIWRFLVISLSIVFVFNEIFGISLIKKAIYPLVDITSQGTNISKNFINQKYVHDDKDAKIKKLEEDNAKLRKKLSDNVFSKKDLDNLNDLKKILNYKSEKIFDSYVSADIISKDDTGFYTNFLISAGANDGVKEGNLVLSGNGIVGIVEKVESEYSKVVSILDSRISLSYKAVRNDAINGIVSQNIDSDKFNDIEQGLIRGYVFGGSNILVGDILVTSGMGKYPFGIEIGEVYEVFEDKSNLLKYITVKPYTDFNDLSKVIIINTREIQ